MSWNISIEGEQSILFLRWKHFAEKVGWFLLRAMCVPRKSILVFEGDWYETITQEEKGGKENVLAVHSNLFQLQSFYWKSAVNRKVFAILTVYSSPLSQSFRSPKHIQTRRSCKPRMLHLGF
jgi:hypothetical protein